MSSFWGRLRFSLWVVCNLRRLWDIQVGLFSRQLKMEVGKAGQSGNMGWW